MWRLENDIQLSYWPSYGSKVEQGLLYWLETEHKYHHLHIHNITLLINFILAQAGCMGPRPNRVNTADRGPVIGPILNNLFNKNLVNQCIEKT